MYAVSRCLPLLAGARITFPHPIKNKTKAGSALSHHYMAILGSLL